jgi:hypothetical protein
MKTLNIITKVQFILLGILSFIMLLDIVWAVVTNNATNPDQIKTINLLFLSWAGIIISSIPTLTAEFGLKFFSTADS